MKLLTMSRYPNVLALRPTERRLALVAGVLIGCWAIVSWVVQPLWDRVHRLRERVQMQTEKLEALTRLVRQSSDIERAYQHAAPFLRSAESGNTPEAFLHDLESLARQAGVTLNLKPRPLKEDERLARFEVELDVEGSQQSLMPFLDSLLHLSRLTSIDRLRLSTIPTKTDGLRANLIVQQLFLKVPD